MYKKGICSQKWKMWTSVLNSKYRISLCTKLLPKLSILIFWKKFNPEDYF